jgi:hypothetical protein
LISKEEKERRKVLAKKGLARQKAQKEQQRKEELEAFRASLNPGKVASLTIDRDITKIIEDLSDLYNGEVVTALGHARDRRALTPMAVFLFRQIWMTEKDAVYKTLIRIDPFWEQSIEVTRLIPIMIMHLQTIAVENHNAPIKGLPDFPRLNISEYQTRDMLDILCPSWRTLPEAFLIAENLTEALQSTGSDTKASQIASVLRIVGSPHPANTLMQIISERRFGNRVRDYESLARALGMVGDARAVPILTEYLSRCKEDYFVFKSSWNHAIDAIERILKRSAFNGDLEFVKEWVDRLQKESMGDGQSDAAFAALKRLLPSPWNAEQQDIAASSFIRGLLNQGINIALIKQGNSRALRELLHEAVNYKRTAETVEMNHGTGNNWSNLCEMSRETANQIAEAGPNTLPTLKEVVIDAQEDINVRLMASEISEKILSTTGFLC